MSDDSASVKGLAKLDNFRVPKNGPKVAKKVVNDGLVLLADGFLQNFEYRFAWHWCSTILNSIQIGSHLHGKTGLKS